MGEELMMLDFDRVAPRGLDRNILFKNKESFQDNEWVEKYMMPAYGEAFYEVKKEFVTEEAASSNKEPVSLSLNIAQRFKLLTLEQVFQIKHELIEYKVTTNMAPFSRYENQLIIKAEFYAELYGLFGGGATGHRYRFCINDDYTVEIQHMGGWIPKTPPGARQADEFKEFLDLVLQELPFEAFFKER